MGDGGGGAIVVALSIGAERGEGVGTASLGAEAGGAGPGAAVMGGMEVGTWI